MFVTLRTNSDGSSITQVAQNTAESKFRRNAAPRYACVRCSTRKLRCTGLQAQCDRCISAKEKCTSNDRTRKQMNTRIRQSRQRLSETKVAASSRSHPGASSGQGFPESSGQGLAPQESTTESQGNSNPSHLRRPASGAATDVNTYSDALAFPSSLGPPRTIPKGASELDNVPRSGQLCSCPENLLDVVHKLDTDYFNIRNLTFDQCLQVLKWLLFRCCELLECASCGEHPTVHRALLNVCEKISSTFSCLATRLARARPSSAAAQSQTDAGGHILSDWYQLSPAERSQKSSPASRSDPHDAKECNAEMLKYDFRLGYSQEEQLLMIQTIVRVRIRDFGHLLERIELRSQTSRNPACQDKLQALLQRKRDTHLHMEASFAEILKTVMG